MGLAGSFHRSLGLEQLAGQRPLAESGIGDVLQGAGDRGVVVGHCLLIARHRSAQLALQAAGSEDRQRDGRPDGAEIRAAVVEHVQPERIDADEGGEIHIGVELRLLLVDAVQLRFGLQARRNHIGTASEQVGGELAGQAEWTVELDRRARDRQAAIRTCAEQRGQAVALQADLFVEREQLGLGAGQARLGLAQRALGFEAVGEALVEERDGPRTHLHRRRERVARGEQARQFRIVAGDGGGKAQPSLGEFGATGFDLRRCRRQTRAVLAPEIEFPVEIEGGLAVVVPTLR